MARYRRYQYNLKGVRIMVTAASTQMICECRDPLGGLTIQESSAASTHHRLAAFECLREILATIARHFQMLEKQAARISDGKERVARLGILP